MLSRPTAPEAGAWLEAPGQAATGARQDVARVVPPRSELEGIPAIALVAERARRLLAAEEAEQLALAPVGPTALVLGGNWGSPTRYLISSRLPLVAPAPDETRIFTPRLAYAAARIALLYGVSSPSTNTDSVP